MRVGAEVWTDLLRALRFPSDADVDEFDRRFAQDFASELHGTSFDALIAEFQNDEDWYGAVTRAASLGISDQSEIAVVALSGQWRTTDAHDRLLGRALHTAAALAFDLRSRPSDQLESRARALVSRHHSVWCQIIAGEYERTQALLEGRSVVGHRGLRRNVAARTGAVDPVLRGLSSFSADPKIATDFPMSQAVGSHQIMQSAMIPAERILATPATGFASMLELELVVIGSPQGIVDKALESDIP